MSKANLAEFRCKMCGGTLEVDRDEFGVAKCSYCGNKYPVELGAIRQLRQQPKPEETKIFVNMTKDDVEKEAKSRVKRNAVYAIKSVISLLSICIIGVYICLMYFMFKGSLEMSTLQSVVVGVIGLVTPAILSIFAKVYKRGNESLFAMSLAGMVSFVIFVAIMYVSISKYFLPMIA